MSGDAHLHCVEDDDGSRGGKVCDCRRGFVVSADGKCIQGKPGHIKVRVHSHMTSAMKRGWSKVDDCSTDM